MNDKDLVRTVIKALEGINLILDESNSNLTNEMKYKIKEIINGDKSVVDNELNKDTFYKVLTPNVTYRHKNNNEIGFMPLSVSFTDNEIMCDGHWMNISNSKRHFSIERDTIVIQKDCLDDWSEVKQAYTTSVYGGEKVYQMKTENENA